eukprot:m.89657 g.89657  ORF g.89657 m.89657 type:complete len:62 (+) comp16451_c0_seq2:1797-1982(+)
MIKCNLLQVQEWNLFCIILANFLFNHHPMQLPEGDMTVVADDMFPFRVPVVNFVVVRRERF